MTRWMLQRQGKLTGADTLDILVGALPFSTQTIIRRRGRVKRRDTPYRSPNRGVSKENENTILAAAPCPAECARLPRSSKAVLAASASDACIVAKHRALCQNFIELTQPNQKLCDEF